MENKIYLASPHMSDEGFEMHYIQEAFDTNWIAPLGPNVNEFEKEFAARDPARHYQHSEIGYNYRMSNIETGVCLPSDTKMTEEDLHRICGIIKRLRV